MNKKKEAKVQDPPRFPKVTVPIEDSFKGKYGRMLKSMNAMLKIEIYEEVKNF